MAQRATLASESLDQSGELTQVEINEPAAIGEPLSEPPLADEPTPSAEGEDNSEASLGSPPNLTYVGPITDLNDLPQRLLASLDEKTAATLHAAIKNPEKFPADFLDHTSIRGQHATSASAGESEAWYDRSLPPLHLEVALVKYDWMVNEAIDRAAGRIDRLTETKVDSKIAAAMFHLRSELRQMLR